MLDVLPSLLLIDLAASAYEACSLVGILSLWGVPFYCGVLSLWYFRSLNFLDFRCCRTCVVSLSLQSMSSCCNDLFIVSFNCVFWCSSDVMCFLTEICDHTHENNGALI